MSVGGHADLDLVDFHRVGCSAGTLVLQPAQVYHSEDLVARYGAEDEGDQPETGHELRNPLGVISNAVYYLEATLTEADETTREYLGIIGAEVANAERIVSSLLDLSRSKPAERERVAARDLVSRVLARQPAPDNVEVEIDIAENLPQLHVDSGQIAQVLINLITNACQAMPEGGRLTISGYSEEQRIVLSVRDGGVGIARQNLPQIFEPLFTTRARGIGLGLAVCRNLVRANGGRIEVESAEGEGSVFRIVLPLGEKET